MSEKPDSAGLWEREGKFYRVWLDCETDKLIGQHIDGETGFTGDLIWSLPTGNWRKLTATAPPEVIEPSTYSNAAAVDLEKGSFDFEPEAIEGREHFAKCRNCNDGRMSVSGDGSQWCDRCEVPARTTEAAKIVEHNTREDEAMQLIRNERHRQISAEGWSAVHDDAHQRGELESAAIVYWNCATKPGHVVRVLENNVETKWPWDQHWFKPFVPSIGGGFPEVDKQRCLIKAGALMLAEIDRLQRTGINPHSSYSQKVWDIASDLAKILPPRPVFTAPEKPELMLIRPKDRKNCFWVTRHRPDATQVRTLDGTMWRREEVDILNPATGEPLAADTN
jgi:hypothetical protein